EPPPLLHAPRRPTSAASAAVRRLRVMLVLLFSLCSEPVLRDRASDGRRTDLEQFLPPVVTFRVRHTSDRGPRHGVSAGGVCAPVRSAGPADVARRAPGGATAARAAKVRVQRSADGGSARGHRGSAPSPAAR